MERNKIIKRLMVYKRERVLGGRKMKIKLIKEECREGERCA